MRRANVRPTVQGFRLKFGFWAGLLVAGHTGVAVAAPAEHHGDILVQVDAWPDDVHALGLDVWTHRTAVPQVLVRVTPQDRAALDASGFEYTVVDPDLGTRVQNERSRLAAVPPVLGGGLDPTYHNDYRNYQAVDARLDALAAAFPGRVTTLDIGLSLEGRAIRGVRITNPGAVDRPVVFVQGCQHAREWIAVAAPMFAAEAFATAGAGSLLDDLLDQVELVVVPIVNPDGYVYSWDVERYWRKNRRDGHGVDLNRNWSVVWGGEGASDDPFAENYHGVGPFSEPESTAIRDFIAADPNMVSMLDVHSFGQLLLYPWGYDYVDAVDEPIYTDITNQMANAMWQPYQEWYSPLQSSDLYPASGNVIDWGYGVHGLYSITIELRPEFTEKWDFVLPPEFIVPTGEELVIGIAELIEASVALGPGLPGDSGGEVETSGQAETGATDGDLTTSGMPPSTSGEPETGDPLPGDTGGQPPPSTTSGMNPLPPPPEEGTGGSSDSGDDAGQLGDRGCGCRSTPDGGLPGWWWAPLLLVARRRRRA